MIKYLPELTSVVLEEIPDKVSLAVEITQCQGSCVGCHSPFLRKDIGEELTEAAITAMVQDNYGVNCFLFLGEGRAPEALLRLARHARSLGLETALYSGRTTVEETFFDVFDYVKTGPFIPEKGPLNNPGTNQRLYYHRTDITARLQHKGKLT